MIRNIEFKYDKDADPDPDIETACKTNINMWLSEMTYELNKENVIVEYWMDTNRITFKNISSPLYRKVVEELNRFDM